jgi:hypothetical protein
MRIRAPAWGPGGKRPGPHSIPRGPPFHRKGRYRMRYGTTAVLPQASTALAALLRHAGDVLEPMARAAAPGGQLGLSTNLNGLVANRNSPAVAEYLSLWTPVAGVTVAYMLRQVAREIDFHDQWTPLPPELRRLAEKRVVWAGELAGHVLRSTMPDYTTGGGR